MLDVAIAAEGPLPTLRLALLDFEDRAGFQRNGICLGMYPICWVDIWMQTMRSLSFRQKK